MDIKDIVKKLRLVHIAEYISVALIVIFFELGILPKGATLESSTLYVVHTVLVLLTLALIPLSITGIKRVTEHILSIEDQTEQYTAYWKWAVLRLGACSAILLASTILYYAAGSQIGMYCAIISFVCMLYKFPTEYSVEKDLEQ
ncbi:MAG: hypothetical protein MJY71_03000 [Bacteroidaceae bacterium]|nr:hypothetical protein [Bacteroidaceae bacterium]